MQTRKKMFCCLKLTIRKHPLFDIGNDNTQTDNVYFKVKHSVEPRGNRERKNNRSFLIYLCP